MVLYGPWQPGRTFTETWKYGPLSPTTWGMTQYTIDPVPTFQGEEVSWRGVGGMAPGNMWRNRGHDFESVLDFEPDFDTDRPSKRAWSDAVGDGAGDVAPSLGGAVSTIRIDYDGGIRDSGIDAGDFDEHYEEWMPASVEVIPQWAVRTSGVEWHGIHGIPETGPPGSLYPEVDPARSTPALRTKVLSLTLDYTTVQPWQVKVKEAGERATGWRADSYPTDVEGIKQAGIGMDWPSGTYEYDVAKFEEWKVAAGTRGGFVAPRDMPLMGCWWTAGWPGLVHAGRQWLDSEVEFKLTFKWESARWRWVYDQATYGRLKVLTEEGWKFAVPNPGENGGFGKLKVNVGGQWVNADQLKVRTPGGWELS